MTVRRLMIKGRVQGVGYRYSMVEAAKRIGVTGWVRNLADGSVEAVVEGTKPQIEAITRWANQGPLMAEVARVDVEEASGHFSDFSITS